MRSGRATSLWVAGAVVVVDQVTKWWAVHALDPDHPRHVVWTLQLTLAHNSGMAFGRGRGFGPVIGGLALVVIGGAVLSMKGLRGTLAVVAAGLVVGGAVGNVVDRLLRSGGGFLRGEVVDFLDLQWWPVFNVADMAITVGGVLLVVSARKATAHA